MFSKIIGDFYSDERGKLLFNNELNLSEVKRMYVIENKDLETKRAWQGHQIEKRWFVAVSGKFLIKLVKIDDFENPPVNAKIISFEIDSINLEALTIDAGHASSIQALEENSKLLVFSDYMIGESNDNYKFNSTKWE